MGFRATLTYEVYVIGKVMDGISKFASRAVDVVRNNFERVSESAEKAIDKSAKFVEQLSSGEIREAASTFVEATAEISKTIRESSEVVVKTFAEITKEGVGVGIETIAEGVKEVSRFVRDVITGEVDIPVTELLPVAVPLIAAGGLFAAGNVGHGVRFLAMSLQAFDRLIRRHPDVREAYDIPDPLRDFEVKESEQPYDPTAFEDQLDSIDAEEEVRFEFDLDDFEDEFQFDFDREFEVAPGFTQSNPADISSPGSKPVGFDTDQPDTSAVFFQDSELE
jgi:hypothetical protein